MMKQLFITASFLGFLSHSVHADTESFFGGDFIVNIPNDLQPMNEEVKKIKYPRSNAPKYIYSDVSTRISIAIQATAKPSPETTLTQFQHSMKAMLPKIIPIVSWEEVTNFQVEHLTIAKLAFTTPVLESDEYNVINNMYFVMGTSQVFIININCTTDLSDRCQQISDNVSKSIRLNN